MSDKILDGLDRRLLDIVQRDSALTAEFVGEKIGLSASAVQRRLTRLREDGVIVRDVSVVDPRKAGNPSSFIVGLSLESERADLLAMLRAWTACEDAVQQAYYVTGDFDFVLVVTAPDVDRYEAFMSRLVRENPCVRRYTTMVVLGLGKRTLFVPTMEETPASA